MNNESIIKAADSCELLCSELHQAQKDAIKAGDQFAVLAIHDALESARAMHSRVIRLLAACYKETK